MTSPSPAYGIDALSISIPQYYIELAELAAARGIAPEKYQVGLGVQQMTIPASHEDPVTLAVQAARQLLQSSGISAANIGLCMVGTETAVDHAKPISVYVHKLLGLSPQCRTYDIQHACFAGTAGLMTSLDWLKSGSNQGKMALVICTDIAHYALHSAAEPTQGAGAVALLISENPRLLTLEVGDTGKYCNEVADFWRPLGQKEAISAGRYSVQCYLEAFTHAYQAWKGVAAQTPQLARVCYHLPYPKLAHKAHIERYLLEHSTAELAQQSFAAEVAPSLLFSAQVGNIYTGSLFLALASLLWNEAANLANQRVGFFSYGSGCMAEFFAGQFTTIVAAEVSRQQLDQCFLQRTKLSISEYENLHQAYSLGQITEKDSSANGLLSYMGCDEQGRRIYR